MSRWFRFYDEALNDPKVLRLPDDLYRRWTQVLCIASKHNGHIPAVDDVAILLRTTVSDAEKILSDLVSRDLLDKGRGDVLTPHNWRKRQYKSDVSTERVKRFRKRFKAVTETPPDTETEQSTDTERKKEDCDEIVSHETSQPSPIESPKGLPRKYEFECGEIRLNKRTFDDWAKAFSYLDLRAELTALGPSDWVAGLDGKWFVPVSGLLAKRNREAKLKSEQGTKFVWRSGMEGVV